jgi:RHS repeat-associated protein
MYLASKLAALGARVSQAKPFLVQKTYHRGQEVIYILQDNVIKYYILDGHGNVRALIDEEGSITDRYNYDAYGNLIYKEGNTDNNYLYTGEYHDATSGLYYLRSRYMNPGTGSFTTLDTYAGTLGDPVSLHKYLYANANPVTYKDPTGEFAMVYVTTGMAVQSEMRSVQAAHDAWCINMYHVLMASLAIYVPVIIAKSNITEMMSILISDPSILTATSDEVEARVQAQAKADSLARSKSQDRYTVYMLEDANGVVQYVGRTKDFDTRMDHHNGPGGVARENKLKPSRTRYNNLTYEQARGMEQTLMVYYHTRKWV